MHRTNLVLGVWIGMLSVWPDANPARAEITAEQFHATIRAKNPSYRNTGKFTVENGKIVVASLSKGNLRDLTFLAELPLQDAWVILAANPITDLAGLRGASVKKLSLASCGVELEDLSPLAGMKLEMLDINGNPFIRDISPLKGMPLKQLSIHGTQVSDLTPLAGMRLEELRLMPNIVAHGWEVVRGMKSLRILSPDWTPNSTPQEFFRKLDSGQFGPVRDPETLEPIGPVKPSWDTEMHDPEDDLDDGGGAMSAQPPPREPPDMAGPGGRPGRDGKVEPQGPSGRPDPSKWVFRGKELGPLGEPVTHYHVRSVMGVGYIASDDQQHYVSVVSKPIPGTGSNGQAYVVDGRQVGEVFGSSHSFCFSPDGRRYAWIAWRAERGGKAQPVLMLDGKPVAQPAVEDYTEVVFSPDAKAAWAATVTTPDVGDSQRGAVWIDGQALPVRHHEVCELTFNADGSKLAWWGLNQKTEQIGLVVNGKAHAGPYPLEGKIFRLSMNPETRRWIRFAPAGESLAYSTSVAPTHVFHDGRQDPQAERVGPIIFSPDGKQMAYRAETDRGGQVLVVNSKVVENTIVSCPVFSPDSQRLAYIRGTDDGAELVVDGRGVAKLRCDPAVMPCGDCEGDHAGLIAFSPDSRHVAAVNLDGMHIQVWLDDRKLDDFYLESERAAMTFPNDMYCPHSLSFSPDGRHLAMALTTGDVWIDGHRLKYDRLPRHFRILWDDNDRLHFQAAKDDVVQLVQVSLGGEPSNWAIRAPGGGAAGQTAMVLDAPGAQDAPTLQQGDVEIPGAKIVGTYTSGREASTVYELKGVQFYVWPEGWRSAAGSPPRLCLVGRTISPNTRLEIGKFSVDHAAPNGPSVNMSYFDFPVRDSRYIAWIRESLETYLAWKKVAVENKVERYDKKLPTYTPANEPEWKFIRRTRNALEFHVDHRGDDVMYTLYCEYVGPLETPNQMKLKPVLSEIAAGNGAETMLAVLNNLDAFVEVHKYLVDTQTGRAKDLDARFTVPGEDEPAAPAQPPAAPRKWTSGRHTVTATLVDLADGQARLRKPDGNVVSVPLAILSKPDQDYLKQFAMPREDKATGPVASAKPPPTPREWTSGGYKATATFAGIAGDRVRLRKTDGKIVTVPLSILSEADQHYLKQFQ